MIAAYTEGDEPVPGFRLLTPLAWEPYGSVWKAIGPGGMEACVKIVSLVNRQRMKEFSALRLVKHVRHPNIVPILAFWLRDRHGNFVDEAIVDLADLNPVRPVDLIIVMGLGDKSLFDCMREWQEKGQRGIPPEELLCYMDDVAHALDHLNQPVHDMGSGLAGIQHCDIKPQNILIVGNAAQVCDLGGARLAENSIGHTAPVGSAAYMAPEYISEGKPSRATDQYSLGICYAEVRTGALPLNAKSPAAAYLTHIRGALDLSLLPEAERAVIARATSVRPENRFPTCLALVRALKEACGSIETIRPPAKAPETATLNVLAEAPASAQVPANSEAPTRTPEPEDSESIDPGADRPPAEHDSSDSQSSAIDLGSGAQGGGGNSDTLATGINLMSQAAAMSFPAGSPALTQTMRVDVSIVKRGDTPIDDDQEDWPVPGRPAVPRSAPVVSQPQEPQAQVAEDPSDEVALGAAPLVENAAPIQESSPVPPDPVSFWGSPGSGAIPPSQLSAVGKAPSDPWVDGPASPPRRRRRNLRLPATMAAAAVIGLLGSWLMRGSVSGTPAADAADTTDETTSAEAAATLTRDGDTPRAPTVTRTSMPFALERTGVRYANLPEAMVAAWDGDRIVIHGAGPFMSAPLDVHGKSLTLEGAPGCRPTILLTAQTKQHWNALVCSDRSLTLRNLELRREVDGASAAPLIVCENAPLHLINCRLDVPHGSAAVICRNPRQVEIVGSAVIVATLGLCVEVGDGSPCDVRILDTTIAVTQIGGAALSLWAPEIHQAASLRLTLERNVISAGRIFAVKALPRSLAVDCVGNDLTFREALVSCVGFAGREGWRRITSWRQQDNHYHAAGEWLRVDGKPGGIASEDAWQSLWAATDAKTLSQQ